MRDRVERRRGHYGRSGSIFGYPRRRLPLSPRTPSVPPLPPPPYPDPPSSSASPALYLLGEHGLLQ